MLKNMRPVDMTPEEREEVEKEAEEVWTWIASLGIAAGILFLILFDRHLHNLVPVPTQLIFPLLFNAAA